MKVKSNEANENAERKAHLRYHWTQALQLNVKRGRKEETFGVLNPDNWPSSPLFRVLHVDTVNPRSNVSDRCYPAVPGEGW